jgi:hypothetical protein
MICYCAICGCMMKESDDSVCSNAVCASNYVPGVGEFCEDGVMIRIKAMHGNQTVFYTVAFPSIKSITDESLTNTYIETMKSAIIKHLEGMRNHFKK